MMPAAVVQQGPPSRTRRARMKAVPMAKAVWAILCLSLELVLICACMMPSWLCQALAEFRAQDAAGKRPLHGSKDGNRSMLSQEPSKGRAGLGLHISAPGANAMLPRCLEQ